MQKQQLGTIQVPSTGLSAFPVLTHPGGSVELRYRYEVDGTDVESGMRFRTARAHRHRAEGHCTAWHIEGAFDTLVEVSPSDWVAELRQAQSRPRRDWGMHHYLIYLDSAGAYEVAAAGWEWLPETPV